ncbi:hypothetical protein M404DRAFT_1000804 [Pisolithus tinctorius Marx 270]|uniref:G domain-containing protein n=1 Tax=Pisolithus tinctorius Marx 270 TaxID=870435 RepID=A0A0C3NST9_PISTI|nr:hypothetical protein M404DRAFT_1000804 [Pisolithus tinctorius Marx 270]
MAPGRVKKFLASLPFGSAARSRRSHESHSDPVTAVTAAAEASNPTIETTPSPAAFRMRVCNTVDKSDIFDAKGNMIDNVVVEGSLGRGYHNIEHELVFKSNPGFVFHDSSGFEAGSAQQFDEMKKFVIDHAAARTLQKRIHAIWYCIPMTDYQRTVTAAEQKFFNECDTGHVPVVVLLTKVDALHLAAIEELLDEGLEMEEAKKRATERETLLLEKWETHIKQILDQCQFPPKMYLALTKMHNESADCTTLIQSTASALNEEGLQRLLISTQQSSIGLCIEYAVYWVVGGMIRHVIERGERYDIRAFESAVLSWFPKHSIVVGDFMEGLAGGWLTSCGFHLLVA